MPRALLCVVFALAGAGCAPVLGIEDTVLDEGVPDRCALVPFRVFFADKPIRDTTVTVSIPTLEQFAKIASDLGVTLDASRGHALAGVRDCGRTLVSEAVLEFRPAELTPTAFTLDDDGIQLGATTSDPGHVGLLNVEAPTELKLHALPTGLGGAPSSIGEVDTEPGELGYILLDPNSEVDKPMMFEGDWGCAGDVPMMADEDSITIEIVVKASGLLNPSDGESIGDVRVRLCPQSPKPCSIDLSQPVDDTVEAVTNKSGAVLIANIDPEGFDGSIAIAGQLPNCE